jgi:hypothetical protein
MDINVLGCRDTLFEREARKLSNQSLYGLTVILSVDDAVVSLLLVLGELW